MSNYACSSVPNLLRSLLIVLLVIAGCMQNGRAAEVLVVCPEPLREALKPWLAHRMGQGHEVRMLPTMADAGELREIIRQAAQRRPAQFLLLVGDADPAVEQDIQARCVPTYHAAAKVNIHWGSEPEIASDNWYADLDDDHLPDLAVGRLTADSPEELRQMIAKIIRYEQQAPWGRWRQRISFVAGVGGFGLLADAMLETCTKKFITEGVPAAFATTMTYASWRSPYCPDPREFHDATVQRFNEGCLFWVYIGHGHRQGLDRVSVPHGRFPILERTHVPKLRCQQGSPIALMLACYTGAFDGPQDCLAETMLRSEGGPVAIVSGSRVTMPYAMAVLSTEMMKQCFDQQQPTLGEVFLHAKRQTMLAPRIDDTSRLLDGLATTLNAGSDPAAERLEHLNLFNLIGDPLLALSQPARVELAAPRTAEAGQDIHISGSSEIDGKAVIELVVRRGRLTFRSPSRTSFDPTHAALAEYNGVYRQANDPRLAAVEANVVDGRFEAMLPIPTGARGECHVRVFVEAAAAYGMGAVDVQISPGQ